MRPLLLVASLALLATAACHRRAAEALPDEEARALLLDRNWIDKMPADPKARLHVFRFVPSMGGGVYQDRTLFFGTFELFKFRHTGDEIAFDLLHTGEQKRVRYRIEAITPSEPGGFDLRLTLEGSPRGPSVYHGWRKEGAHALPPLGGELAPLAR